MKKTIEDNKSLAPLVLRKEIKNREPLPYDFTFIKSIIETKGRSVNTWKYLGVEYNKYYQTIQRWYETMDRSEENLYSLKAQENRLKRCESLLAKYNAEGKKFHLKELDYHLDLFYELLMELDPHLLILKVLRVQAELEMVRTNPQKVFYYVEKAHLIAENRELGDHLYELDTRVKIYENQIKINDLSNLKLKAHRFIDKRTEAYLEKY